MTDTAFWTLGKYAKNLENTLVSKGLMGIPEDTISSILDTKKGVLDGLLQLKFCAIKQNCYSDSAWAAFDQHFDDYEKPPTLAQISAFWAGWNGQPGVSTTTKRTQLRII